jgi:hypothetical protein
MAICIDNTSAYEGGAVGGTGRLGSSDLAGASRPTYPPGRFEGGPCSLLDRNQKCARCNTPRPNGELRSTRTEETLVQRTCTGELAWGWRSFCF